MQRWICVLLAAVLLSPTWAGAQPKSGWHAGAAKTTITPELGVWMSGYGGRTKPAEGKIHDLWAKALVLQDPHGAKAVLVTLDLVGISRELSVAVCKELQSKHKLARADIILSVSHTHSGPVVGTNLAAMFALDAEQQKRVDDYARTLHSKIVQVVDEAARTLQPAALTWANGSATFAVNRRNNKEADILKLRADGKLKGPVDHNVPVLAVRDDKGKLRAVVFGYACHATVLSGYDWCGDYPGFAQLALERENPGAVALFWAGCGADQNPLPRRTVALAERYGKELAAAVQRVLDGDMKPLTGKLTCAYREIELPYSALPSREKLVEESLGKDKYVAIRARQLLKQLEQQSALRGSYPYPVQLWQLGAGPRLLTLGGEVVVDYALRLKKELPAPTWVMGYANDVMAYIPSRRVLEEGGYEGGGAMVYYGLPATWGPRVEELIVAAAHALVQPAPQGQMAPALRELLSLMRSRLLLMEQVARLKWTEQRAIADPVREAALLKSLTAAAQREGLDPAVARRFFEGQIKAAKLVQEEHFEGWRQRSVAMFPLPMDFLRDIRARIDSVSLAMLPHLRAVHELPLAERRAWRLHCLAVLHGPGITDAARRAALGPLWE